ncbi:MAG: glucose 1-dehydrogenase [Candidatus Lokiarchaeota archaeon]|nr:glucose 1-dehydrogenase [Candidatus Lokiarchaeota archaeon]
MADYDLDGKTAIVTGASSGLGEQFSYALAESGANVVLASRSIEELEANAEKIESDFDVAALAVQTDVLKESHIMRVVNTAVDEFGKLDLMVNNVGNYVSKPLIEQTLEDWHYAIDLNLTSAFLGSREAAKVMIPKRSGVIVNMASTFAYGATQFPVVGYYAAKGGVVSLTKALAVELGEYNIRVNAIAPGFFPTDQSIDAMTNDEIRKNMIEPRTALPMLAEKEWIRGAICFLASDDARYITGHVLAVDGGWLAF